MSFKPHSPVLKYELNNSVSNINFQLRKVLNIRNCTKTRQTV